MDSHGKLVYLDIAINSETKNAKKNISQTCFFLLRGLKGIAVCFWPGGFPEESYKKTMMQVEYTYRKKK